MELLEVQKEWKRALWVRAVDRMLAASDRLNETVPGQPGAVTALLDYHHAVLTASRAVTWRKGEA